MFFHRKAAMENSCRCNPIDFKVGLHLAYHGNPCVVEGILLTSQYRQVKLKFRTDHGRKPGTDGWYDMQKLQQDFGVCIVSGMEPVSQVTSSEKDIWFHIGDTVSYLNAVYKVGTVKLLPEGAWVRLQGDSSSVPVWKRMELIKAVKTQAGCTGAAAVTAFK